MRLVRFNYTQPSYRTLPRSSGNFTRSPWAGLETEIDRLFGSALTNVNGGAVAPSTGFPVDLYKDKDNTYVRAELPGVKRDDINVEVVDGNLTVSAHRSKGVNSKAEESFSFSRSIELTEDVQADKVSATYEHGVLTVTLPKSEASKPKKIAVQVK